MIKNSKKEGDEIDNSLNLNNSSHSSNNFMNKNSKKNYFSESIQFSMY